MSNGQRRQGGLSARTLLIAGAASAAAAFVVPMLWRPGTVFAAAMTPVIVALVSELLHRPVDTVTAAAARRAPRRGEALDRKLDEPFDPLAPPSADELDQLPQTTGQRAVHRRRRPLTARQWKLGLATGLVAFAAVAAIFTASELLAGDSLSGGGKSTTFWGGSERKRDEPANEQDRPADKEASPTPTPEATETPTPTPAPTLTATPTPTPTPTPAAPAPAAPAPAP